MPRKRKAWSKTIEEAGIAVRVFERAPGSLLYRDVHLEDGARDRKSLGHRDRTLAEQQARALARRLAELRHAGVAGRLTYGQLSRLYFRHRAPLLSAARQQHAAIHDAFFRRHFGDAFPVDDLSQTHIDAFVAARRAGALRGKHHARTQEGTRDGTIRQNLNWLASALRWARGFRIDGRRLLATNPLDGVTFPREKNVRRPVASEERYKATLGKADAVDPRGRLACLLALARYTGRRVNAMCQLRAADVLLTKDAVVRALAASGQDVSLAEYMPHGAIRWRAATDKQGFEEITALGKEGRAALDAYLRAHPAIAEAPLFPGNDEPSEPLNKHMASYYLMRAEEAAGLPHLERGLWHPYRRLWAVSRKHLPDVDVAKAGGWRDLASMKQSYQRADPATVLRVVENPAPREEPGSAARAGGPN